MIRIESDFINYFQGLRTVEAFQEIEGDIAKRIDNRETRRFVRSNQTFYIKCHQGIGWQEIIKNLSQMKRPILGATNEWLALHKLKALGIPTLMPVAFGKRGMNPARQRSFLVTLDLGPNISLEDLTSQWQQSPPDPVTRYHVIKSLAQIAKTLHDNGLNHRDFYLCHFLLRQRDLKNTSLACIYLIDLHRMQIRRRTPKRWKIKDLGSLYFSAMDIGLTNRDILRFIHHYSDRSLSQTLRQDKTFWAKVHSRAVNTYQKVWKKTPPDLR